MKYQLGPSEELNQFRAFAVPPVIPNCSRASDASFIRIGPPTTKLVPSHMRFGLPAKAPELLYWICVLDPPAVAGGALNGNCVQPVFPVPVDFSQSWPVRSRYRLPAAAVTTPFGLPVPRVIIKEAAPSRVRSPTGG